MKFATLLKQNTAATTAAVINLTTAPAGYFTLAQAIAAGELAVGDETTFMISDSAGNKEFSLFEITDADTITRVEVHRSTNNDQAETFPNGAVVANMQGSEWLSKLLTAEDGLDLSSLEVLSSLADTDSILVMRGSSLYRALGSTFKSYAGGMSAPASTVSGVSVSPSTATVAGGGAQTFTATVTGTNSPSQAVSWTASAGSITAGGVFTAPAATGSTQTITITATSTQDNTKSSTATVTVSAAASTVSGVTVSPATANVAGAATQQFAATVAGTNSPSQGVTWSTSAGTINSSGLFTAPVATSSAQTITITATSQQDGSKSGTATVTVAAAAPTAPAFHFNGAYTAPTLSKSYGAASYTAFGGSLYLLDAQNAGINFANYDVYFTMHPASEYGVSQPSTTDQWHSVAANTFALCNNPSSTPGLAASTSAFVYKSVIPAGTQLHLWAKVVAKGAGAAGAAVWMGAYDGTNSGTPIVFNVTA